LRRICRISGRISLIARHYLFRLPRRPCRRHGNFLAFASKIKPRPVRSLVGGATTGASSEQQAGTFQPASLPALRTTWSCVHRDDDIRVRPSCARTGQGQRWWLRSISFVSETLSKGNMAAFCSSQTAAIADLLQLLVFVCDRIAASQSMYGELPGETARGLTARYPHLTVFGRRSFTEFSNDRATSCLCGFNVRAGRVAPGLDRLLPAKLAVIGSTPIGTPPIICGCWGRP